MKQTGIHDFHEAQTLEDRAICEALRAAIDAALPDADAKIWSSHPVWFLNGNPIVGYSMLKDCIRLMFWSGADFDEPGLTPRTGRFRDPSVRYRDVSQIDLGVLARWLRRGGGFSGITSMW